MTGGVPFVAATLKQRGRGACDEVIDNLQVTHHLKAEGADASEDGTGRGVPMVCGSLGTRSKGRGYSGDEAAGGQYVPSIVGVRRLTPVECERLQGFPDGWSCLCQDLSDYATDPEGASMRCTCADGPRYKALGNAVTVNVVEWIGKRLVRGGLTLETAAAFVREHCA